MHRARSRCHIGITALQGESFQGEPFVPHLYLKYKFTLLTNAALNLQFLPVTISVITLFPSIFSQIFSSSILGIAQRKKILSLRYINLRDFAKDRRRTVDDRPYGGGVGMLVRIDIMEKAIQAAKTSFNHSLKNKKHLLQEKVVLLEPAGTLYNQQLARGYACLDHLILVCGHYEGVDARIHRYIDDCISIGRYILTGGEIPAMVIVDSVTRLLPSVLEKKEATKEESYSTDYYLEPPQYTRPEVYKGLTVPKILLSGNHDSIKEWKRSISKERKRGKLKF